jgi:isoleucyl-tRNA synthetase
MAPILSFTAEEIMAVQGRDSVMLTTWHVLPACAEKSALTGRWQAIRTVRADVMKAIEDVRSAGGVGSSLQAEVEIQAAGETHDLLASLGDDLKFVLICSKVALQKVGAGGTAVIVTPSPERKCARCWHWRDDVGHDSENPELCGRCTSNLFGAGEARAFA